MNLGISTRRSLAFTFLELLVVILMVAVIVGMFLPPRHRPAPAQRIKCVNNLKNIGLAAQIFAADHQDRFPCEVPVNEGGASNAIPSQKAYMHFQVMSNGISTPKILICPAEKKRKEAGSLAELQNANVSYFAGLNANPAERQRFLAGDRNLTTNDQPVGPGLVELTPGMKLGWTKELHNLQGNVALGDGSVQQFSAARLAEASKSAGANSITLVVP